MPTTSSEATAPAAREPALSIAGLVAVWGSFGLATVLLIRVFDQPGIELWVLLALAAGSAAPLSALVWFFLLGVRRSLGWAVAMLVPYVNLIAASRYARLYWRQGAWAPATLALAGMAVQTAAMLRLLTHPPVPALI